MPVPKYIGETEKNLAAVPDQDCRHDVVYFFGEGDALFCARTDEKHAHDRYAS